MVDRRWTSAPPAKALVEPATVVESVAPAVGSGTSPSGEPPFNHAFADCVLCHGTGVMAWTQMCPDGVLRQLTHPCTRDGHAPGWHRSVDAEHRVVDAPGDSDPDC
jgi:hypothetical protein